MQHVMRIQGPTKGDEVVTWDPADAESVTKAQAAFDLAISEKKVPHKVERTAVAKPGEPIKTFDPNLGEIIFVAPLAGG